MSDFVINKETACCFTGHRNRDLPFFGDRSQLGMKNLVSSIQLEIEAAAEEGCDTFISGMAEGIDLICAEIVCDLIVRKNFRINLVCAMPYRGQGMRELRSARDKYIYNMILKNCARKIYVSETQSKNCYMLRNRFMVDNSSRIIGVYREKKRGSGTLQTINMAKAAGLDMHIIRLDDNPVFYLSDEFPQIISPE